jgi:FkbM family methyltransferase
VSLLKPQLEYVLGDVGANIGLFSRQMFNAVSCIGKVYSFEPEATNFALLAFNLAGYGDHIRIFNAAVTDATAEGQLFMDEENSGNYSILQDAMRAEARVQMIRTLAASEISEQVLGELGTARIIWKSDTQGYDEWIATLFPDAFWSKVDVAMFELWRINRSRLISRNRGF